MVSQKKSVPKKRQKKTDVLGLEVLQKWRQKEERA